MNGTLCKTESLVDDLFSHITVTPAPHDLFATAPMQAIWREFERRCEEDMYTSFEAAISDRVLALKERHISKPFSTYARGDGAPAMNRLIHKALALWHRLCFRERWKRRLFLSGTALMLMLIGFDLMGLLVLNAR